MIHQLMDHHIDRGQRLDQKNRQGFGCGLWGHGKQLAGFTRGGFDIGIRRKVEVEGTFGGLVEFFESRSYGDIGSVSGGLGVGLIMKS